jgi:hypothetical protein
MTIGDIIKQSFHLARTCRSLWLFGFVVGLASGGSSNGGSGGGSGGGGVDAVLGGGALALSSATVTMIVVAGLLTVLVGLVLRLVSEGALIEGIVKARQGGALTTRQGFRAGRAHLGVLFRISLIYGAALVGSVALLAAPGALAFWAVGPIAAVLLAIPAIVIAVPWLVTLHLLQAFAWRIAVLENRGAVDAIGKARLFLHGRIMHGLKLIVATFIGTFVIMLLGFAVLVPVALVLVALAFVVPVVAVIVVGCLVLLPAFGVLTAIVGTFRSSVWTVGYVTQVEA